MVVKRKTFWTLSQLREDHLLLRGLLEWLRSMSRNNACVFRNSACVRGGETGFCKQLTTASEDQLCPIFPSIRLHLEPILPHMRDNVI